MWLIYESNQIGKNVSKLPSEILKRYEKWKDVIRISGLEGLRMIKGFNDEKLKGKTEGMRSSRLGEKYRVIYSSEGRSFRVYVIEITAHDYRSK